MIGPANMKADLVAQVNALTAKALADPLVKARYNDLGATRWPTSPAEIKAFRCRGVKAVADHEGGRHQAGVNGLCLKDRGLAQRISARRGPMTGCGVTRLFIVGERWITLSPIHLTEKEEEVSTPKKVTASSGNVFADLGFGHPEEYLLKAALVREIRAIIKRRKLSETKAAAMLGLKQPDVSALVIGRVGKFSIDRLLRCLDRMDYNVDVVVRHKPRRAPSREIAA